MSRVLLAWELGGNYGHLSRLLPLARRLKQRGHEVLVAARDVGLAAEVLSAESIPFVKAPSITSEAKTVRSLMSYSEMLLAQGWDSAATLWGLVQAWGNLVRLYGAAALVLDYAPSALLAARVLRVPCTVIGTGFEIPPLERPFPAFPGFPDATVEDAVRAEQRALERANRVLDAYQTPRLSGLCDLFQGYSRWLTTFPELDHYGPRAGETYVGPIGQLSHGKSVEWPAEFSYRILAYLRADTPGFSEIIQSLSAAKEAAVICFGSGMSPESVRHMMRPGFEFIPRPVVFEELLPRASALLSYAPAGSVAQALIAGVPQVLAPVHVEAQMTAFRVQCMGAGVVLRGDVGQQQITSALYRVLRGREFKVRALDFARRYQKVTPEGAIERIVDAIEVLSGDKRKQETGG